MSPRQIGRYDAVVHIWRRSPAYYASSATQGRLTAHDFPHRPAAAVAADLGRCGRALRDALTAGNTGTADLPPGRSMLVAPDGRFLLNASADDAATTPITIIQNWESGLAARERR
jgi:hypothetical protein